MIARPPPARTKPAAASTLGLIPPASKRARRDQRVRLRDRHAADRPGGRSAPPLVHRVHVGEDHQHLRLELPGEDRRRPGPCPPPRPRPRGRGADRRTPAGRRRPRRSRSCLLEQPAHHRELDDGQRASGWWPSAATRRRRPGRPLAPPRAAAPPPRRSARGRSAWSACSSAGSYRSTSVWVTTVTTSRSHPRRRERVLQRLLEHVADPAGRLRDQDAERQRLDHAPGDLVAHQLVADLRPVAVHDDDAPALARQLDDRRHALARMAELVGDRGAARRRGRARCRRAPARPCSRAPPGSKRAAS